MAKSAGYAVPFANKMCYMEKHGYTWMLDVVHPKKVPMRPGKPGSKDLHMAPTWYKPGGIGRWLPRVDFLVYLDMDLVVKEPEVDFVGKYVGVAVEAPGFPPLGEKGSAPASLAVPDLVVTDHNKALNNGAFVLRNTAWARKFVARWDKISATKFPFPFTDNGSFIETILSFIPKYAGSNHQCMKHGIRAGEYLDCAVSATLVGPRPEPSPAQVLFCGAYCAPIRRRS